MHKKQWICTMLALALLAVPLLAPATDNTAPVVTLTLSSPTANTDTRGIEPGTHITVASSTAMSGYFSTELWGKNTSDMEVRALIHSYETVFSSSQLEEVVNGTVVKSVQMDPGIDGYQVYTIELHDDLFYSDGSPITAEDYVFAILLSGAPEVDRIGGVTLALNYIDGYIEYQRGVTDRIRGLRYLDTYTFSLHTDGNYMPYFYGIEVLLTSPLPISVIAPGCAVQDDGDGAYITTAPGVDTTLSSDLPYTPGIFSSEMLQETLLHPETGYEFFPQVTSGPYMLESYDAEASVATFVANPYFKGNFEGQKPHIERITFRQANGRESVEMLEAGEVDLLNKVTDPNAIAAGTALAEANDAIGVTVYPRTGLAYLAFACESPPMDSVAVRKAISMCLDIDLFVNQDVSESFRRVYGFYGLGQWMLEMRGIPEQLEALRWEVDIEAANALLDEDGWVYDENGGAYVAGEGKVRHKYIGETLTPLVMNWAGSSESRLANEVEDMLAMCLPRIGVGLEATQIPFAQLLQHYYRQVERTYNAFFLASSFDYYFDPSLEFSTDSLLQGVDNKTGLIDEELEQYALLMRETAPDQEMTYIEHWLDFQERFVELMPMVPFYSSAYQDYYTEDLKDYRIEDSSGWAYAILYAYMER